jgi:uncharacterized protein (DUF1015 family)
MAEVRGFQGWRYGAAAGLLERLIAPPYDIITPAQAAVLRARSPENVVHLELPEGPEDPAAPDSRYARAAGRFRSWREAGVLVQETAPALYPYAQEFQLPGGAGGSPLRRLGVLGAVRLEPYETGGVRPHEQTFPKHREDRFQLLTAAGAQFSPIMAIFPTEGVDAGAGLAAAAGGPPAASARDDDGVLHSLWVNPDPAFARWFGELLAARPLFIADGHHRYETALRYQAARRAAGDGPGWYDFIMVHLLAMEDPGLALLPTHRLVRGLPAESPGEIRQALLASGHFSLRDAPADPGSLPEAGVIRLVTAGPAAVDLVPAGPNPLAALAPERPASWLELEAVLLHRLILERLLRAGPGLAVTYTRDAGEAVRGAASGEWPAAFLLPPPRIEQLRAVALAGELMPEKTTYFWPKAWAGLVIHGDGR